MTTFLAITLILISILLILVVLVQRGRGGGLSGAFGAGGGGSSSAFGTKTGDVFTTITVVLFVAFLLLVVWLNFRFQKSPDLTRAVPTNTIQAPANLDPDAIQPTNPETPAPVETPATTSQPK